MKVNESKSTVFYKTANEEDFLDINLCANEYIDLIDNFKERFLNREITVFLIYFNRILAGLLVAEDKSHKINSIEKIIPSMCIHLIYINPVFRKKLLGKQLLHTFLNLQKKNGYALIYVKIPQNYKSGIKFFCNNSFFQKNLVKNKIVLEINLWNDFGLRNWQLIEDNFNDNFL
jgi:GNAT superfamily N-acetyltransferase